MHPPSCVARRTRNRLASTRAKEEDERWPTPALPDTRGRGRTGRGSSSMPILGFGEDKRPTVGDPIVIVLDDDDGDDEGDKEEDGGVSVVPVPVPVLSDVCEKTGGGTVGNGGGGMGVSSRSESRSAPSVGGSSEERCENSTPVPFPSGGASGACRSSSLSDRKEVEVRRGQEPACSEDTVEGGDGDSSGGSVSKEERSMPPDTSDTSVSTKGGEEGDSKESPDASLGPIGDGEDSDGAEPVAERSPNSSLGLREEKPSSLNTPVSGDQRREAKGQPKNCVASRTRLKRYRGMLKPVDYSVYFKNAVKFDEEESALSVSSSSSSSGSDIETVVDHSKTGTDDSSETEGEIGVSFKKRRFWGNDTLVSTSKDEDTADDSVLEREFGDIVKAHSGYFERGEEVGQKKFWMGRSKKRKSKKRKHAQALDDDELYKMFVNTIQKKTLPEMLLSLEDEMMPEGQTPTKDDELLPLIFSFAVEGSVPVEKSEFEKAVDQLWVDYDFAMRSNEIGSHDKCEDEGTDVQEVEANHSTLCSRGKHQYILDEQMGIRCKICYDVQLEIKYVFPSWGGCSDGISSRKILGNQVNNSMFDELLTNEKHDSLGACNKLSNGTVWDTIPGIKQTLYPHQQEGFEFMWRNLAGDIFIDKLKSASSNGVGGCVISHAPGTGKSRLTIVFLQTFMKVFPECRPVIVAPRGMLLTWEKEFEKWKVDIPMHILNRDEFSGKEDFAARELVCQRKNKRWVRLVKLYSWDKGNSILGISYGLFGKLAGRSLKKHDSKSTDISKILLERPDLFVFDEGHTARNEQSIIWKVLEKIKTERRIILSGTPFQNNFGELYNTLCLVRPKFADKISYRTSNFCQRKESLSDKEETNLSATNEGRGKWASLTSSITDDSLDKLRAMIKPFVHVHHGSSLKSLPGLKDCLIILNPVSYQKGILESFEDIRSDTNFRNEHIISLASVHPSLLLFPKLSEKEKSLIDGQMLESLRLNPNEGVKTRFIVELVRLCEVFNERIVIFSQYIDPLSLIRDQLVSLFGWTEGKELLIMNGKIPSKYRQLSIDDFNNAKSRARVLLASTKACCEGISLTGASRVVLLDVVWNPSVERQAISRAYRIGQERMVYTYHLITSGTREGDKYYRQAEKDRMSKLVFSSRDGNNNMQDSSLNASADKILKEMVEHDKLKDMFKQILYQPKESNLIDAIKF